MSAAPLTRVGRTPSPRLSCPVRGDRWTQTQVGPWSEMDSSDLKNELDHGRTIAETARPPAAGRWTPDRVDQDRALRLRLHDF